MACLYLNIYFTIEFFSAKRFKTKIFRLFAVSYNNKYYQQISFILKIYIVTKFQKEIILKWIAPSLELLAMI